MKILLSVILLFTGVVANMIRGEATNQSSVPNEEITEILKRILKRLDTIEDNVRANRDDTKEVRREVKANREVLLKLHTHVRDQQMKLDEVTQVTQVEQREIAANSKSVEDLSKLVDGTLRNVSKDVSDIKRVLTEALPGKSKAKPAPSCSWLKQHSYCVRSGRFWIKDGGKVSMQFCKMDEDKPVTTTVVPTASPSTKVHPTTQPIYRGASCKELKNRHPHLKSGTYNITVGGSTFEAFCDMDTDRGGWTMVGNAVVNKQSEAKEVEYTTIQHDDYKQLQKVSSGRFLLSTDGMNSLFNEGIITEIRLDCYKRHHGRRLHLKTKGSFVLEWLLHRRSKMPIPQSCGTFSKLEGDTSYLGGDCRRWRDMKWWNQHIYSLPMIADDHRTGHHYWISLNYNAYQALWCDDYTRNPMFSNIGNWSIYIR